MALDLDVVLIRLPESVGDENGHDALRRHVLRQIDGQRSIGEILAATGLGDRLGLIVCELIRDGLIAPRAALDSSYEGLRDDQQHVAKLTIAHLGDQNAHRVMKIVRTMGSSEADHAVAFKKIDKLVRLTIDETKASELSYCFNRLFNTSEEVSPGKQSSRH